MKRINSIQENKNKKKKVKKGKSYGA